MTPLVFCGKTATILRPASVLSCENLGLGVLCKCLIYVTMSKVGILVHCYLLVLTDLHLVFSHASGDHSSISTRIFGNCFSKTGMNLSNSKYINSIFTLYLLPVHLTSLFTSCIRASCALMVWMDLQN